MPGKLPHTEISFVQTAADQQRRDTADEIGAEDEDNDPTTLKVEGKVTIADDDAGSDPYNRTGRFRRLVR